MIQVSRTCLLSILYIFNYMSFASAETMSYQSDYLFRLLKHKTINTINISRMNYEQNVRSQYNALLGQILSQQPRLTTFFNFFCPLTPQKRHMTKNKESTTKFRIMCPKLGSLALVRPGNIIKESGYVQVYYALNVLYLVSIKSLI